MTIESLEGGTEDHYLRLRIPNLDVRQSLERGYIAEIFGRDFELDNFILEAKRTANHIASDPTGEAVKKLMISAYSRLPHDWVCKDEKEAKRYFLAFMVFARAEVVGEEQHSLGRPDAVLKTEKGIYIFEFKYDESAEAALDQCHNKHYADAFAADDNVHYVGVNYDPETRTINDLKIEEVVSG